ncbi:AlpA family transcriptional regulator [Microbacterium sp. MPKO10]|uniref:helix-turn-helix transcriptional regulator n=1 Tax=Microbacterium sp. MPKO10 TaxID=2989818 RepID=UPI0022355F4A|nr:helix-turn-helix domain-containing protein [Microbacterium sp. MPKO10]MCW4458792.1 helix-turn-helix domain-containing protein [Microbacterium sp. MPKO10]
MSAKTTAPVSSSLLDSLITADTLAERLGTKRRTVDEWRITGKGPKFIRVGRSVRYRPEAVEAWLLSQERRSTSEEVR